MVDFEEADYSNGNLSDDQASQSPSPSRRRRSPSPVLEDRSHELPTGPARPTVPFPHRALSGPSWSQLLAATEPVVLLAGVQQPVGPAAPPRAKARLVANSRGSVAGLLPHRAENLAFGNGFAKSSDSKPPPYKACPARKARPVPPPPSVVLPVATTGTYPDHDRCGDGANVAQSVSLEAKASSMSDTPAAPHEMSCDTSALGVNEIAANDAVVGKLGVESRDLGRKDSSAINAACLAPHEGGPEESVDNASLESVNFDSQVAGATSDAGPEGTSNDVESREHQVTESHDSSQAPCVEVGNLAPVHEVDLSEDEDEVEIPCANASSHASAPELQAEDRTDHQDPGAAATSNNDIDAGQERQDGDAVEQKQDISDQAQACEQESDDGRDDAVEQKQDVSNQAHACGQENDDGRDDAVEQKQDVSNQAHVCGKENDDGRDDAVEQKHDVSNQAHACGQDSDDGRDDTAEQKQDISNQAHACGQESDDGNDGDDDDCMILEVTPPPAPLHIPSKDEIREAAKLENMNKTVSLEACSSLDEDDRLAKRAARFGICAPLSGATEYKTPVGLSQPLDTSLENHRLVANHSPSDSTGSTARKMEKEDERESSPFPETMFFAEKVPPVPPRKNMWAAAWTRSPWLPQKALPPHKSIPWGPASSSSSEPPPRPKAKKMPRFEKRNSAADDVGESDAPSVPATSSSDLKHCSAPALVSKAGLAMPAKAAPELPAKTALEMPTKAAPEMPTKASPEMPTKAASEMPPRMIPPAASEMPPRMIPPAASEMPPRMIPPAPLPVMKLLTAEQLLWLAKVGAAPKFAGFGNPAPQFNPPQFNNHGSARTAPANAASRSEACWQWERNGECIRGANCRWAHNAEPRKEAPPIQRPPDVVTFPCWKKAKVAQQLDPSSQSGSSVGRQQSDSEIREEAAKVAQDLDPSSQSGSSRSRQQADSEIQEECSKDLPLSEDPNLGAYVDAELLAEASTADGRDAVLALVGEAREASAMVADAEVDPYMEPPSAPLEDRGKESSCVYLIDDQDGPNEGKVVAAEFRQALAELDDENMVAAEFRQAFEELPESDAPPSTPFKVHVEKEQCDSSAEKTPQARNGSATVNHASIDKAGFSDIVTQYLARKAEFKRKREQAVDVVSKKKK